MRRLSFLVPLLVAVPLLITAPCFEVMGAVITTPVTAPSYNATTLNAYQASGSTVIDFNRNATLSTLVLINPLTIPNGGTGAITSLGARTNLGLAIGTDIPSPTGTGASGTWGINITGTAGGGASPTGAAGGDLSGTYPNPTLAATGSAGVYGGPALTLEATTDTKGRVSLAAVSITIAGPQVSSTTGLTEGANLWFTSARADARIQAASASATPLMDGVGAVGTSTTWAHADHVHPTDTSRAPLASPTFTGTPAAPTPLTADNSTTLATTAYVKAQGYTGGGGTVTSVGISLPTALFSAATPAGSPITGAGTIFPYLAAQTGGTFFAGPASGSAAASPSFRVITNADLPGSGATAGAYGDASHVASVTVDAHGVITSASSTVIAISGTAVSGNIAGQAGTVASVTGASGNIAGTSGGLSGTPGIAVGTVGATTGNFSDTTDAVNSTTGPLKTAGGLAVAKSAYFGGTKIDIAGTNDNRSDIRLVNKAVSGWLTFAARNTTGTEAVYDLSNIGAATVSSLVDTGSGSFAGVNVGGAIAVSGTTAIDASRNYTGGTGTFNGAVGVIVDDANTVPTQLVAKGASNHNQQLLLGYNTTSDYGSIQAVLNGVAYKPLALNSQGAAVWVGATTDHSGEKLQVTGSAYVSGALASGLFTSTSSGSFASYAVATAGSTATLNNVTTMLANSAFISKNLYSTGNFYWPGMTWYTTDNNSAIPKAAIWAKGTSTGSLLYFGVSNTYNLGVNENAMILNQDGSATFLNTVNATTFVGALTGSATGLSGTPNITVSALVATSITENGALLTNTYAPKTRDAVRCIKTASIALSSNVAGSIVTFPATETFKTNSSLHSTSSNTGRITIQTTGTYRICAMLSPSATSGGNSSYTQLFLRKNGTTSPSTDGTILTKVISVKPMNNTSVTSVMLNDLFQLTAGDWIEILAVDTESSALSVDSTGQQNYFEAILIDQ